MSHPVTLTGYLGRDPQFRETKPRTIKSEIREERFIFENGGERVWDEYDIVEEHALYDIETTPRTYAVMSLAVHHWESGKRETTWERIVAWDADNAHFGLRRLGWGDQIEITGWPDSFETADGSRVDQIVLSSFRLISRRLRAPEESLFHNRQPTVRASSETESAA